MSRFCFSVAVAAIIQYLQAPFPLLAKHQDKVAAVAVQHPQRQVSDSHVTPERSFVVFFSSNREQTQKVFEQKQHS